MSWNPSPTIGGASWGGNPPIATKQQLTSSIAGLYNDLKDFDFSTISVSTLTVPEWISTAVLYVSDIKGANIDISGITIDSKGIFNAPVISVSSMNLKGFDSLLDVDVSFDFGLGSAIGGVVGGLGAAVGGGLIAVGTGAGLAIQGAATGAATLIAGRPQNFISQTNYETINFTTQLQVSTLGYANPVYSSIFRTVSSIAPTQIPGREIYTSSFFYPGQICIRSVSDPFNLMSGDSNLNTSTIQSFGQWTAFEGLETENIVANSISTNFISSGLTDSYITTGLVTSTFVGEFNTGQFKTLGVATQLSMDLMAPVSFALGAGDFGRILGGADYLWLQSDQDIIFSKIGNTGTALFAAQLSMGSNAYESLLQVSSIFSRGEINANSFSTNIISSGKAYIGDLSSFANDSYVITNQFAFVSTLTVDFQTFAGDKTTMYLQKIIGSNNAFLRTPTISTNNLKAINIFASSITAESITAVSTLFITSTNVEFITSTQTVVADLAIFSSIRLSTIQELGLTTIYNYPGAITAINTVTNTTSPVVGIGFKAQINLNCNAQTRIDYNYNQITGTVDGSNYYPVATYNNILPQYWELSNLLNINTDSIEANSVSVSSILTPFPSLSSYSNIQAVLGTTGSPGVYLPWFNISTNKQQMVAQSLDVYFGNVGLAANNGANLPYSGLLSLIGDNFITSPFVPTTVKSVFGNSVSAGANDSQNFTYGLRYGVDYDVDTNNLWWYGYSGANNTSFFIPAGQYQIQIRAYPF